MYPYSNEPIPAPIVSIEISAAYNPNTKSQRDALIDSGADTSCIPPSVINELNLIPIRDEAVRGVTGETNLYIYAVNIRFHGIIFSNLSVIGLPEEDIPLIGRDILNKLHLCLDGPQKIITVV
ncbi:MAG: retroviral-like aspartic protease family protein [Thermodesulfobacteriota bacterium]